MHAVRRATILATVTVLGASAACAGTLEVTVLDGGTQRPSGVKGATVAIEGGGSTTTDLYGRASLASVAAGRHVVRVSASAGFTAVRFVVDVPSSGTVSVPPLLLPRVPTGSTVTVPTNGSGVVTTTTQVESAVVPTARLTVPLNTTITGAGTSPKLAIFPVDRSLTPAAFVPGFEPARLYAVSPGGAGFSSSLTVRLPNDDELPAGTQVLLYGLYPRAELAGPGWVELGTATVDAGGTSLTTDTALVTSATLLAVDSPTPLPTTYRVSVVDWSGAPVSGATVQVHRLLLAETATPGTYEARDVVATGAPVRALVSKDFGSGLVLHALSDPTLVTCQTTLLHAGQPLRLALTIEGDAVGGDALRNGTSADPTYLLTEAVVEPHGSHGAGGTGGTTPQYTAVDGRLPLTFCGSVPPVVSFSRSPSGTLSSPDTAPVLSFTVLANDVAFDPDSATNPYTTTARITSASFSVDGGSTWHAADLTVTSDLAAARPAGPGGSRYQLTWDLWSIPAPAGISSEPTEVRLRVSVLDAPGGNQTTGEAAPFRYQWPSASVLRVAPPDGAVDVLRDALVLVDFAQAMDSTTITTSNITVTEVGVGSITTHTVTYLSATRQAQVKVATQWPKTTKLVVSVGAGVRNAFGVGPASATSSIFTTGELFGLTSSDPDGLLDFEESHYGTSTSSADTDGDGLDDDEELFLHGTSPTTTDTDGDGTPDGSDSTPLGTPAAPRAVGADALAGTFKLLSIAPVGSTVASNTTLAATFNHTVSSASVVLGANVKLELGGTPVTITQLAQPNPRTLLFQPSASLTSGSTYTFTVTGGTGAVQNTSGAALPTGGAQAFRVGTPSVPTYEATRYHETLAMTKWERFPLTAPTAGGRDGMAVVIPSTHKLLLTTTDVTTPGRGLDVSITRIYRNNEAAAVISSCFGNQWFFPYDRGFTVVPDVDADGKVDLRHRCGDGRTFDYRSNNATNVPDAYVSPPGFHDELRDVTEGGVTYLVQRERRGGTKYFYRFYRGTATVSPTSPQAGDVGVLVRIVDHNLNAITVARHAATDADRPLRISSITDDLGRVTTFDYATTAGQRDLVTRVEQFQGSALRSWEYEYYTGTRNLRYVRTPSASWRGDSGEVDVEGAAVTASRVTEYAYDSSGGVHDLRTVKDPRGHTSMAFSYDANHDVTRVDHGGLGSALYSWTTTASGVTRATQVDRNGNVLTIDHESQATAPFHNILAATLTTRGLHPGGGTGGAGEPASYTHAFLHDSDSEVIQIVPPRAFALNSSAGIVNIIRGTNCGCPEQIICKSGVSFLLDVVWVLRYDPQFKNLTSITDPRGNGPSVMTTGEIVEEDVETQTPRGWVGGVNAVLRDAHTTFMYYDHEDTSIRMSADQTSFGSGVPAWFTGATMPQSYGDSGGALHTPGAVFSNDPDFIRPKQGGNPVAMRGPRAVSIDPTTCGLKLSGGQPARQDIQSFASFNQYGQRVFEVEPDGSWNRSEWYLSGLMNGYLKLVEVDTNHRDTDAGFSIANGTPGAAVLTSGKALLTTFETDAFGNVNKVTNPRGNAWRTEYDLLNLVTRTIAPAPFLYERTYFYDGNNNLVETQLQNVVPNDLDDDGLQDGAAEQRVDPAKGQLVTRLAYNDANMLVHHTVDAFDGRESRLTTTHQYDPKQLRIGVRLPEGNTHWWRYDERDLVYMTIEGASDLARSETTRFDYDENGNLTRRVDDDGNGDPDLLITYDDFDRPTTWTDELENQVEASYDLAGHMVQRKVFGQTRSRADTGGQLGWLENTVWRYDEAGRNYQVARELFFTGASGDSLSALGLTPGSGRVSEPSELSEASRRVDPTSGEMTYTRTEFSVDSLVLHVCDDNGHDTDFTYDTADRLRTVTDELGSVRTLDYDRASNVIRVTDDDRFSGGGAEQTYRAETFFDELDRAVATVTNLGNTRRFLYDSRGLVVQVSDAMGPLNGATIGSLPLASEHGAFPQGSLAINDRGNTTRFVYDGLGRHLRTIRDLRQDGTGGSVVVSQVSTYTSWDGNSRVAARVDPNGNFTAYAYDHQDRLIRELFADGTERRLMWNKVDTLSGETDGRGVAHEYRYDVAERRMDVVVSAPPAGAGQTLFAAFDHDGLGRMTRAEDDDSIVQTYFDAMGRVFKETQSVALGAPRASKSAALQSPLTKDVLSASDGVGNRVKITYPSGAIFQRQYDGVDRLSAVRSGYGGGATTFATFTHVGMGGRRAQREYLPTGTGAVQQRAKLAFDGDRRVTRLENLLAPAGVDGTRLRGFAYAWDRENNRRFERRLNSAGAVDMGSSAQASAGPGEAYRYDSLYRLVRDDRDVADGDLDAIGSNLTSVGDVPFVSANASQYKLDAAGNRRQTVIGGVAAGYGLEAAAQTNDLVMNQYTSIGSVMRSHDLAGNLTGDGGRRAFFDADNRLVQWLEGSKDIRYRYDALGRRTVKEDKGGSFSAVVQFWDGWQEVEEFTTGGVMQKQYVFGEGIDEVIRATVPDVLNLDPLSATLDLYYHQNSLGSVVAVTDRLGTVVESYRYTAYGAPTIYNAGGTQVSTTQVGNPFMFTGRRLDYEEGSNLYYYRLRYYDPAAGRFISRDPLGLWGDAAQLGNGQAYCGQNPVNFVDPMGDRLVIPNTPEARGFLNRVGHYGGRRLSHRPPSDSEIDDALARNREQIEEEAGGDQGKLDELTKEFRDWYRDNHRVVEVDKTPGDAVPEGVSDADRNSGKTSPTLGARLDEVIGADYTIEVRFDPTDPQAEKAFYRWLIIISWTDPQGRTCLDDTLDHLDNAIIRFVHELWRAMHDPQPGEDPEGKESRDHPHGDDFVDDPVNQQGENPVREELDMPQRTKTGESGE